MSPKASSKNSASELRHKALQELRALSVPERQAQSERLQHELAALFDEWSVQSVAAFWPLSTEPQISPLLTQFAKRQAHRLLLPRIEGKEMRFVVCRNPGSDLIRSPLGFLQPSKELPVAGDPPQLFLVPGLLFGPKGERIGRGGGYYDRYFGTFSKELLEIPRIGIAFTAQYSALPLPQEHHDIPVHFI